MKPLCVYMLASGRNGTLYGGVTSGLIKRVDKHKNDFVAGFGKTYRVHDLVWFEQHEPMDSAILHEKAIKGWNRNWQIRLIETNPNWRDLYSGIL